MTDTAPITPPVREGDRIELTVDRIAAGGDGVGRYQGFTVFVPFSAPGDSLRVEIREVHARFARARLQEILTPSSDRVSPRCRHFGVCGGCGLQHLSYPAQLAAKKQVVADALARIGGVTPEIRDPIGMADPWEYRSRSRFTARDGAWGFHDQGGRVFAVEECPISHPAVVDMLDVWRDKAARRSDFMQAEMRVEPTTDERLVLLIAEEGAENVEAPARALAAARPQVQGVVCWTARSSRRAGPSAHRLAGRRLLAGSQGHLIHALGEYRYQVSAESFFQVNPLQARRLLDCVREGAGLAAGAAVVDGYCGVGTFLFPLAAQAGQAHGIEDDGFAFRDAQANWRQYGIDTCRLLRGKVEQLLPGLADKGLRAQTVVLDPPRRGCGRAALEGTVRVSPARIVMISCDPATLARDLRVLGEVGYETTVVQPIDMFPQTAQIECVALCQRAGE